MIYLALRLLAARPKQTLLMLLGFFFGSMAFVLMSGLMLGFRRYLVNQLVNTEGHIHIEPREQFLAEHELDRSFFGGARVRWLVAPAGRKDSAMVENPQAWYRRLEADPRVAAYTPQLSAAVIFSKGKAEVSATLIGCDPLRQTRVTTIGEYITEGRFEDLAAGGNRVALGNELMKRLGVRLADTVMVSLAGGAPAPLKVAAVFSTGSPLFDRSGYASLADVQHINRTPNRVNKIVVRTRDHALAARPAIAWAKLGPDKVESWDQRNKSLFEVFKIQDAVRFLSVGAVILVAGFGIYNILNMTVMQKRRDIAILRSMGYSGGDVLWLFLSQGLILGAAGVGLGLLSGWGLSFFIETIPLTGGREMLAGPGHLLMSREPAIYLQAGLLAFLAAAFASALPARAAGKLPPIEVIRRGAE